MPKKTNRTTDFSQVRFSSELISQSDQIREFAVTLAHNQRTYEKKRKAITELRIRRAFLWMLLSKNKTQRPLKQSLELHDLYAKVNKLIAEVGSQNLEAEKVIEELEDEIAGFAKQVPTELVELVDRYVKLGQNRLRFIVRLDMQGYGKKSETIHFELGAFAVKHLDGQVWDLVRDGLAAVNGVEDDNILGTQGDAAILTFDLPQHAHEFAVAFYEAMAARNQKLSAQRLPTRLFRVGIAAGEVEFSQGLGDIISFSGHVLTVVTRLEENAQAGEVVLHTDVYQKLPTEIQKLYGPMSEVTGNVGEFFQAHKYRVIDP